MKNKKHFLHVLKCVHSLSRFFSTDEYGNLVIEFFCEGAGEDRFHFQIETDISDEELDALLKNKKPMKFEMTARLLDPRAKKQTSKPSKKLSLRS